MSNQSFNELAHDIVYKPQDYLIRWVQGKLEETEKLQEENARYRTEIEELKKRINAYGNEKVL